MAHRAGRTGRRRRRTSLALALALTATSLACRDRDPIAPGPGAEKFTPALRAHYEAVGRDTPVPVVFLMRRQLTAREEAKLFASTFALDPGDRLEAQRVALIEGLRSLAAREQRGILDRIGQGNFAGRVERVRPLWLANLLGMTATEPAAADLAAFDEVESVHLDLPRPVLGELEPGWGLKKIRAHEAWTLDGGTHEGQGRIVAVLDTGVEYDHPALEKRMWVNEKEDLDGDGRLTSADLNGKDEDQNGKNDDVHGYDFSGDGSPDPRDTSGHGTLVAGIVVGQGANGTHGVAPGAKIMALRESNQGNEANQQECWAAMQYALAMKADVVNYSSGWLDVWDPVYEAWRLEVKHLMDAGTLFVTISHNDANVLGAPYDVRTPGRVPQALTVGATRQDDGVAWFSNRGPVSWQEVVSFGDYPYPPGLTKPDVVAPGVLIPSARIAKNGGGFSEETGTSYAAPHAAGVAALLRQKDPKLNAYELKYLLEETAVDLGAPGPDNASGWGRIDAVAALEHEILDAPYDVAIAPTGQLGTSPDVWIDQDGDGTPDAARAGTNHVYARIRNLGGRVVANPEIRFYAAPLGTFGAGSFDPDGDGDPSDGAFSRFGTYVVPTLGPKTSKHDTATGVARWEAPAGPSSLAVQAAVPPIVNEAELDVSNNLALHSVVAAITSKADVPFLIVPPPKAPTEPFAFEIEAVDVPRGTTISLVYPRDLEDVLMKDATGFEGRADAVLDAKPVSERFKETLRRDLALLRSDMKGKHALLAGLVRAAGEPIPVRLLVDVPGRAPRPGAPRILLATLDGRGERVGGITVDLVAGVPSQKGGPYLPRR